MISFCCQQCSREYKVDDKYAGRKARCKQCDHYNVIPGQKPAIKTAKSEDMISFSCESCSQKLRVKSVYAGKRVKCSGCGEPCRIPNPQSHTESADQPPQAAAIEESAAPAPTSKTVTFNCQMCSAKMQADESQAGEVLECPECQCYVEVPGKKAEISLKEEPAYQDWEDRSAPEEQYTPVGTSVSSPRSSSRQATALPAAWKIPMAIGTGLAFTMGGAIAWAAIAAITGLELAIIIIGVGALAGVGLTLYTEDRNVMLGMVAVLIGLVGMLSGKVLVAKYAIIPYYNSEIKDLIDVGVGQLSFSPQSNHAVFISSCMEKRDNGDIPEDFLWPVFWDYLYTSKINLPRRGGSDPQLEIWSDLVSAVKSDDNTRRNLNEIRRYKASVETYVKSLSGPQKSKIITAHKGEILKAFDSLVDDIEYDFFAVVKESFGVFDFICIPIGLFAAFNVGSGRGGSES